MFQTDAPGFSWTKMPDKPARARMMVKVGVYVIEHVATGKLLIASSHEVSQHVDTHLIIFQHNRHPSKRAQALYNSDAELKVYEYPTRGLKAAQALERDIRDSVSHDYLIMDK